MTEALLGESIREAIDAGRIGPLREWLDSGGDVEASVEAAVVDASSGGPFRGAPRATSWSPRGCIPRPSRAAARRLWALSDRLLAYVHKENGPPTGCSAAPKRVDLDQAERRCKSACKSRIIPRAQRLRQADHRSVT